MHLLNYLLKRVKNSFKNSPKLKNHVPKAFSLVEISIVILIIGVLIAATISARTMIKNSRIAAAQSKTRSGPVNSIPNSVIWLESSLEESFSSDESKDGTALTGWNDIKTGSASSVNDGAAGSTNPIFSNTINSIHAVKFSGDANSYFEIDGSALNGSDYTIIVLEKRQGDGANYFLSDDGTSTADNETIQLGYSASGTVTHSQGSGNKYSSAVGSYSASSQTPRIFAFIQNESFGKKTYVNGFLAAENTADKTKLTGINKLHLGKNYTGEIGEFLIFDRALKKEERTSIEKYLLDKWRMTQIVSDSNSSDCSSGVIKDSGCAAVCSVSILGESTTSLADGASEDFDCDQTGYVDSVSSYTCSGGTAISNSCDCDTTNHYSLVSGTCQPQCDLADITGLASAYVDEGVSSSATCTTGYAGTINYSCTSGTPIVDSGSCGISCTISGETGIIDGTVVTAASGTQSCNADGFDDEVTYTCNAGVFEKDSGQECETCEDGYEGATCALSTTINCTGGSKDTSITGYTMHVFTTLGDAEKLDCRAGASGTAEILIVAGGGGGGGVISGGGGAGGVIYNASYALTNTVHDVTIGDGGVGGNGWDTSEQHGKKGENSEFASLVAIGGGGGSDHRYSDLTIDNDGGSGGGSALHNSDSGTTQDNGFTTSSSQGNNGGTCSTHCYDRAGGGGGAGSSGGNASSSVSGSGGTGVDYSTNFSTSYGDSGWFASGGSGGVRSGTGSVAAVSAGGGGIGTSISSKAADADANTGGGGGGAGFHYLNSNIIGGKGGSGIIIIKYAN